MISIIIPTLEEEKLIKGRIEHLKKLTLPHEIIISDGRSMDRTVELARMHADKVVIQEETELPNPSRQRNNGAKVAEGEFFVFLDASTWISDPNTFFSSAILQFKNPHLIALGARLMILPEYETNTDKVMCSIMNFLYAFLTNTLGMGSAQGKFQMIRASAFARVGGYRSDFATGEDIDMFRRLSKIGMTKIDRSLTVYHVGRREHAYGWMRLLWVWTKESVSIMLRGKPISNEWKPVR